MKRVVTATCLILLLPSCCTAPLQVGALASLRSRFAAVHCLTQACAVAHYNAAAALTEAATDGCKLEAARAAVGALEAAGE